ncbi:hypothetical protein GGI25_000114 [Coemansia spiralis]|uniref:Homeobox domain-containing protein n=2 Tax=Coemansia TaxID=4863 RepID=A0A9W8KZT4_9FUNG|nr:hypothetical protein BX070DRAFT_249688 [Coemansia spiralis]KAJ1992443.1 hypothetical protein EDC05_002759 [Coemansia umbellata]KAJ2620304.1 hypothetical protein GGI26_005128 [Coemansia sp. RSA 1358]KAJ2681159.1 hypothetical protein GGI25_000114 [Coemansia spiralis]
MAFNSSSFLNPYFTDSQEQSVCWQMLLNQHYNAIVPQSPTQDYSPSMQQRQQQQQFQDNNILQAFPLHIPVPGSIQDTPGAILAIPFSNSQSADNMHTHHASIGNPWYPDIEHILYDALCLQETRVSGRRLLVNEFHRRQERESISGEYELDEDNYSMCRLGLANNRSVFLPSDQQQHQHQHQHQQESVLLKDILLAGKQQQHFYQGIQTPIHGQALMQTSSYMQQTPTAAASLYNDSDPAISAFNNLLFTEILAQVAVSSAENDQSNAEFVPNITITTGTINSSISSPIASNRIADNVASPTSVGTTQANAMLLLRQFASSVDIVDNQMQQPSQASMFSFQCSPTLPAAVAAATAEAATSLPLSPLTPAKYNALSTKKKTSPSKRANSRKRQAKCCKPGFTPEAQAELKRILCKIQDNPFPDVHLVAGVCERYGLSNKQIRNWFALRRFRYMTRIDEEGITKWRFREGIS